MRPPWEVRWLGLPLVPFIFTFWVLVLVQGFRKLRKGEGALKERRLVYAMVGTLLLGYLLTPFGADPSGRYFLPLSIAMALGASDLIVGEEPKVPVRLGGWLLLSVLAFNLWGHIQTAIRNPPGLTTQFDAVTQIDHRYDASLIEFLEAEGEERGKQDCAQMRSRIEIQTRPDIVSRGPDGVGNLSVRRQRRSY